MTRMIIKSSKKKKKAAAPERTVPRAAEALLQEQLDSSQKNTATEIVH